MIKRPRMFMALLVFATLCAFVACGGGENSSDTSLSADQGSTSDTTDTWGSLDTGNIEDTDLGEDKGVASDTGGGCQGNCGEMVLIPAGKFMQGCDQEAGTCTPQHEVNVPAFEIDKYEVTNELYSKCMSAGACHGRPYDWVFLSNNKQPVTGITWDQAKEFCTWAGKRLCTESEWEKAARGTDGRKYPWGNDPASCKYAVMDEGGEACGNNAPLPVGSKPAGASPYGVMDMSGSAAEWVEDDWHPSYEKAPTDGSAWINEPRASYRVIRGGSFADHSEDLLSATGRHWDSPSKVWNRYGFRCCRSK